MKRERTNEKNKRFKKRAAEESKTKLFAIGRRIPNAWICNSCRDVVERLRQRRFNCLRSSRDNDFADGNAARIGKRPKPRQSCGKIIMVNDGLMFLFGRRTSRSNAVRKLDSSDETLASADRELSFERGIGRNFVRYPWKRRSGGFLQEVSIYKSIVAFLRAHAALRCSVL